MWKSLLCCSLFFTVSTLFSYSVHANKTAHKDFLFLGGGGGGGGGGSQNNPQPPPPPPKKITYNKGDVETFMAQVINALNKTTKEEISTALQPLCTTDCTFYFSEPGFVSGGTKFEYSKLVKKKKSYDEWVTFIFTKKQSNTTTMTLGSEYNMNAYYPDNAANQSGYANVVYPGSDGTTRNIKFFLDVAVTTSTNTLKISKAETYTEGV